MSIEKVNRKNKGIGYRVRIRDMSGSNRGRIFDTKKEAEIFESNIISTKAHGIESFPQNGKKLLIEVFDEWFKQFKYHSPKYVVEIESLWKIHVSPTFGGKKLESIKTVEIRNWLLQAENQGLSTESRNRSLRNVLVRVLDFAVDMGYLSRNVARGSNGKVVSSGLKSKKVRRLKRALTFHELIQVAIHCGIYETLILLMGLLGPRWAEAIGLKVKDFDLDSKTVTIQRSLSLVRSKFIEKSTKSGSIRVLILPNFLIPMLEKHLVGKSQDDLVFTSSNGAPIDISNFRKRIYEPAFAKAGVLKANLKDLRTTAVSFMISLNSPITVVAKIAGHADPSITLRHYSELFDGDFKQASIDLEAAFLKQDVHEMYTLSPIIKDIAESSELIYPLTSGNESGPCRDRTDDPQIKSLLLYRLS